MNAFDNHEVIKLHNIMYEIEEYIDDSIDSLVDVLDSIIDTYDESSPTYRELSMIEDKLRKASRLLDKELD